MNRYFDVHIRYDLNGMENLTEQSQTVMLHFVRAALTRAIIHDLPVSPSEFEMNVTDDCYKEHPNQVLYASKESGDVEIMPIGEIEEITEKQQAMLALEGIAFLVSNGFADLVFGMNGDNDD